MQGNNKTKFNVVIRVRPQLGDEANDLTTDDDLMPCVKILVIINL